MSTPSSRRRSRSHPRAPIQFFTEAAMPPQDASICCNRRRVMQNSRVTRSHIRVGVVVVGYWGRNLVRNFHQLGALGGLCDADPAVAEVYRHKYASARFYRDFGTLLADG